MNRLLSVAVMSWVVVLEVEAATGPEVDFSAEKMLSLTNGFGAAPVVIGPRDFKDPPSVIGNRAVHRSLRWLKKVQNPDGSWGGDGESKPAATALALSAFMTHGEGFASPEFGNAVKRGFDHVFSLQLADGRFQGTATNSTVEHALMSWATCDGYGYSRQPADRARALKAADFILKSRNPSGLWGRQIGKSVDDAETSAWQIVALHSMAAAGIRVEEIQAIRLKTAEALKKMFVSDPAYSNTAAIACALLLLNRGHDRESKALMKTLDELSVDWNKLPFPAPVTEWYFATQAKFRYERGGHRGVWTNWNRTFMAALIARQKVEDVDGRKPGGYWDFSGMEEGRGRVCSTALCCMMIYVPMAYTPPPIHFDPPDGEVDSSQKKPDQEYRQGKSIDINVEL